MGLNSILGQDSPERPGFDLRPKFFLRGSGWDSTLGQGSSQGARIRPWAGVPSTLGWGSSREAGFDLGDSDLRLPWRPASDPEVEVQVDARTPSAVSLRSPVRVRDDLRPRISDSLRGQPAIASPSSCRSQTTDLGLPWRPILPRTSTAIFTALAPRLHRHFHCTWRAFF